MTVIKVHFDKWPRSCPITPGKTQSYLPISSVFLNALEDKGPNYSIHSDAGRSRRNFFVVSFIGLIKDELVYFSKKRRNKRKDFYFRTIVSNSSLRKNKRMKRSPFMSYKGSQMSSHISEELLLKKCKYEKRISRTQCNNGPKYLIIFIEKLVGRLSPVCLLCIVSQVSKTVILQSVNYPTVIPLVSSLWVLKINAIKVKWQMTLIFFLRSS